MSVKKLIETLIPKDTKNIIRVEDGTLLTNLPKSLIDDGTHKIEVVDASVCNYIIDQMHEFYLGQLEELIKISTNHTDKLTNAYTKSIDIQIHLNKTIANKDKEYKDAIEQNARYKEWYGELVSPISILNQLYRFSKSEMTELVSKKYWTKYAKTDGGKYWIEMFEYWKIIKVEPNHRYFSLVTWWEAKSIIFLATARNENNIDIEIKKEYQK